ncbi:MAG: hypothetical protein C4295_05745 [Candidatus Fervidibacterota bacterium]
MNLTLTPRDKAILGAFLVLLVGGSWAYIRWATAPASTGRPLQPTTRKTLEQAAETTAPTGTTKAAVTDVAPAPFPTESESPAALPRRDYRFIAERNIFQPPSERTTQPTKRPSTPSRPRKATPPQPFGGLAAPPPLPPAPPPPPSSPPTQMASRPANLAATGVARIGDETYVLLENPQTRDVAFVRVGESAFGYQVSGVGENYVEVKQGDVAYRITLGEGKQERRILAAAAPSGLRPPTQGSPFVAPSSPPREPLELGGRRQGGSTNWVNRVVERWQQLPEFVRDRILQRIGEFWQQMPPDQQQQILQRLQQMGVNFSPPGR